VVAFSTSFKIWCWPIKRSVQMAQFRRPNYQMAVRLVAIVPVLVTLLLANIGCGRPTRIPPVLPVTVTPQVPFSAAAKTAVLPGASPTSTPTSSPAQAKRGGTLKAAVSGELAPLDPFLGRPATTAQYLIFDPFVNWKPNADGKWGPAPGLFSSWDVREGEIYCKLPMGVQFHDGSEWNADIAIWNLERYRTAPQSPHRADLDCLARAEKIDDYTVRLKLKTACASLLATLSQANSQAVFPVSRKAAEKWGLDEFTLNPAGAGPFRLDIWKKGEYLRLQRWEQYWRRSPDGGKLPYLAGVELSAEADEIQRLIQVRSGDRHITELLSGKDTAVAKSDGALAMIEGPWIGAAYHLVFNSRNGVFRDNLRLRQAVLSSIDREDLAKQMGLGAGMPVRYAVLPGSLAYDELVPSAWYDLAKARQLLRDAGYPNGVSFTLDSVSRPMNVLQSEVLRDKWDPLGLRARPMSYAYEKWLTDVVDAGSYELAMVKISNEPDPALDMMHHLSGSSPVSLHRNSNPDLDRCLTDANAVVDPAKRKDIYRRCQGLAYNDAFRGYLWAQTWNWALRKEVKGFVPGWGANWDLSVVWLDQ
jgi:ABC-type transport system substrate-binding protein